MVETQSIEATNSTYTPRVGVVLDSTTAVPQSHADQSNVATGSVAFSDWSAPQLGLHYAQAMEYATNTTSAIYHQGLALQLNWEY